MNITNKQRTCGCGHLEEKEIAENALRRILDGSEPISIANSYFVRKGQRNEDARIRASQAIPAAPEPARVGGDAEINKFLHERIMGECWHEVRIWRSGKYGGIHFYEAECPKCGDNFGREEFTVEPRPEMFQVDYCNDLNAVSRVSKAVVKKVGELAFTYALAKVVTGDGTIKPKDFGLLFNATARQRAEACKAAWESQEANDA